MLLAQNDLFFLCTAVVYDVRMWTTIKCCMFCLTVTKIQTYQLKHNLHEYCDVWGKCRLQKIKLLFYLYQITIRHLRSIIFMAIIFNDGLIRLTEQDKWTEIWSNNTFKVARNFSCDCTTLHIAQSYVVQRTLIRSYDCTMLHILQSYIVHRTLIRSDHKN